MSVPAALSAGPEASGAIGARGTVLAVTRHAVFLRSEAGHILGLTGPDAPDGPLTVRLPDLAPVQAALDAAPGAVWTATVAGLELPARPLLTWGRARPWEPAVPRPIPGAARDSALRALAQALRTAAGQEASVLPLPAALTASLEPAPAAPDPILARVWARLDAGLAAFATAWQAGDAVGAAGAACGLLGTGPGLTPAGDDVLCGLLAALGWAAPAPDRATALAAAVLAAAPARTHAISSRLLAYAARGILYAPALDLGAALLAGDVAGIAAPARALFAVGNSSGRDLAVGLLWGLALDPPG